MVAFMLMVKKINQSFINAYQRSTGTGTVQGYQEDSNWDIKKNYLHIGNITMEQLRCLKIVTLF